MIIDLPTTNSSKINQALVDLREKGGSIALGRVLTLVIVTEDGDRRGPDRGGERRVVRASRAG